MTVLPPSPHTQMFEAAVRKLQYGRMAGPDRLRGELFKGLYEVVEVYDAENDRWCEKHVSALQKEFLSPHVQAN